MFIQTETTPNPATLKFLPGRDVTDGGSVNFPDENTGPASPLAVRLFAVDDVDGVFFGADFITVTTLDGDWTELKPQVLGAIMEHFMSGDPVLAAGAAPAEEEAGMDDDPADAEIIDQIKVILNEKVRPAVARDGGDIIYHGFHQGVVYLRLQGACSGCPSSTATLKHGIENLLKHFIPEVVSVEQTPV